MAPLRISLTLTLVTLIATTLALGERYTTCVYISGMDDCKFCKQAKQLAQELTQTYSADDFGYHYETVPFEHVAWSTKKEKMYRYLPSKPAIRNHTSAPFVWLERVRLPETASSGRAAAIRPSSCTAPSYRSGRPRQPTSDVVWLGGASDWKAYVAAGRLDTKVRKERKAHPPRSEVTVPPTPPSPRREAMDGQGKDATRPINPGTNKGKKKVDEKDSLKKAKANKKKTPRPRNNKVNHMDRAAANPIGVSFPLTLYIIAMSLTLLI